MSKNKKCIYRRILLKISGEALQGMNEFGIDVFCLKKIAQEIISVTNMGIQVGLVIGSGNLFRGVKLSKLGLHRVTSDYIGILSTVINSLAMQNKINELSCLHNCLIMSAIPINGMCEIYNYERAINLLKRNVIIIFAAGTGNPFFTTDSAACLRGIEMESEIMLKGTNVNGVYSKDPKKHSQAIFYKQLTYNEVLQKELKVMDLTAFTLARDNKLPIRVFNINQSGSLSRILMGSDEGTFITE